MQELKALSSDRICSQSRPQEIDEFLRLAIADCLVDFGLDHRCPARCVGNPCGVIFRSVTRGGFSAESELVSWHGGIFAH